MAYQDPMLGLGYAAGPPPQQQYGAYAPAQYGTQPYGQPNYAAAPSPMQQQQQQPQPQYAKPQPAAPQSYGASVLDPILNRIDSMSSKFFRVQKVENLERREVYNHSNFDIDTKDEIQGIAEMKPSWKFVLETALAMWVLFNAVSTIMIILTNFSRAVDPAVKEAYGSSRFDALMNFIVYFPLVYFFVSILLVNNYYSERVFYNFLKRGCIIDFPPSANTKALVMAIVPLLFIITTVLYLGTVIGCFIKFEASVGVILIFINNLFIGIGMSWYRQQSIESKFISITDFIQAFPDRGGAFGNMDEQSLFSAQSYIAALTLTESTSTSYSSYMREYYWKHEKVGLMGKIGHKLLLIIIIGGMAGVCVGYFIVLRGLDVKSTWQNSLNPCIQVCIESIAAQAVTTTTSCNTCVCRCMSAMNQKDSSIFSGCSDYGSVGLCRQLRYPLCPPSYGYCNFTTN